MDLQSPKNKENKVRTEFNETFTCLGRSPSPDGDLMHWKGMVDGNEIFITMSRHAIKDHALARKLNAQIYIKAEVSGKEITHSLLRRIGCILSASLMKCYFHVRLAGTPEDHGLFSLSGKVLVENIGVLKKTI